jgi:hypothetical protein
MPNAPRPKRLREPVQVYLAPDDSELLNRLASDSGLSKAEILRRGVRSFAREYGGESPMLRFIMEGGTGRWPAAGVAANHDAELAESYRGTRKGTGAMRRKRR